MSTYDGRERCDSPMCPGYEEDGSDMVRSEDGVMHPECRDAMLSEEERFWRSQFTGRDPERIDAVLDRVFDGGDRLRDER